MFSLIVAKDLFSWEDLVYEVKPGISQITGFNFDDNTSEGAGKSSVPNILCWTLYGRIPKDAKIDEVVREGCKGGVGAVHLSDGTSIHRSRRPNDLYLVINDKEVRGRDAKETQILINKLIGLDFEAFCQSVYFAQNYPKKFVSSSETDKAAILSEIQDLTLFDKARTKALAAVKMAEVELGLIQQEVASADSEINKLRSNAELLVEFIDKFESDKESKICKLQAEIDQYRRHQQKAEAIVERTEHGKLIQQDIDRTNQMLSDLLNKKADSASKIRNADSRKRERERLEGTAVSLGRTIDNLSAKLKKFEAADNACPVCGVPVTKDKLDHVFKEKVQLAKEYDSTLKDRKRVLEELKDFKEESVDDLRIVVRDIEIEEKKLKGRLTSLQSEFFDARRAIDEVKECCRRIEALSKEVGVTKDTQPFKELERVQKLSDDITKLEIKAAQGATKATAISKKIDDLTILKTGFKEVKQFVFQSLLNELSNKATALASDLFEVPIFIKFTNEDEEGAVSKILTNVILDNKERSLGLYSGGQYKRIELAVDLALASIVASRAQNAINFRILDEPFKDLSATGAERVVKLLEGLKGSTIVIEHNEFTKAIINNTFHIEYRNGVSQHAS